MRHQKQRIITNQIIENTKRRIEDQDLQGFHVFVGKSNLVIMKMEKGIWGPRRNRGRLRTDVRLEWCVFKKELINRYPDRVFFWKIPGDNSIDMRLKSLQSCIQFYHVPGGQSAWPQEWKEYIPIYNDYLIFEDWERKSSRKVHCRYCGKIIKKSSDPRRCYCDNNNECKKQSYILTRKIKSEAKLFFNKAAEDKRPLILLSNSRGGKVPSLTPDCIFRACKNCGRQIPVTKHGKAIFCDRCNTPAERMKYYRQLWGKREN